MAAALCCTTLAVALAGASRPALRGGIATSGRATSAVMKFSVEEPIGVGNRIPDVEVEVGGSVEAAGMSTMTPITQVLGSGKAILLGMPGAFTPTCNDIHLPGFYKNAAELKALGVETIALVTTNDKFVNAQWQKSMEECMGVPAGQAPVVMLSDARGDLSEALGLIGYLGRALGVRSKRFALVVENGVVEYKAVDEGSDALSATSAESIVAYLKRGSMGSPLDGVPPTLIAGAVAALAFIYWFLDSFV